MGREAEVHDTELEGMHHVAVMAVENSLQSIRLFNYVHIFLVNLSAIRRVEHLKTGSRQATAIAMNALAQRLEVSATTYRVE